MLLAITLWLNCGSAHAELRALLIGVSGYPALPERLHLQGPRNDVQRMRQVLLGRGFDDANIRLLADGVAGAALPTRANILTALDGLAKAAQPGDTVFLHFAGHGSRQPADRRDASGREQPGGLSETFLPFDVGGWDGGAQTVKNAIVNFELRAAIDRISARGAFVWGVFDACHSATLVRGSESPELRYRHVEPADLGIPPAALEHAQTEAPLTRGGPEPTPGALDGHPRGNAPAQAPAVFFYATQIDELTPELRLPSGAPQARPYGLFSFVVGRAIERGQPMSYRQMAQYILSEYGALSEARATPLFSGDGLDRTVFGQGSLPVRQWPLEAGTTPGIAIGSLSGVGPGTVFAVLPDALAKDADRIGFVQVVDSDLSHSTLAPLARDGVPAPAAERLRAGLYLRLAQGSLPSFSLRTAFDARGCSAACVLGEAVQILRRQGVPGVDAQWVASDAHPDVLIQLLRGRVLFLPATQQADDPHARQAAVGFDLQPAGQPWSAAAVADRVAGELHAIARARNLLALGARFAAQAGTSELTARLQREARGGLATRDIGPDQVPHLKGGDRLVLALENRGAVAQDVTVLYVDADQGIDVLFPSRLGESNRIEAGGRQAIDGIVIGAPPSGIEHLLLISVAATHQGERADFSFLRQPALERRRGAETEDLDAFADAAFADYRTRGATRVAAPTARTAMQVFTLDVGP